MNEKLGIKIDIHIRVMQGSKQKLNEQGGQALWRWVDTALQMAVKSFFFDNPDITFQLNTDVKALIPGNADYERLDEATDRAN